MNEETEKLVAGNVNTAMLPVVANTKEVITAVLNARKGTVIKETSYSITEVDNREEYEKGLEVLVKGLKLTALTGISITTKPNDEDWKKFAHEFDKPVAQPMTTMLLTNIGSQKTMKPLNVPFEIKAGVRVSTPFGEFVTTEAKAVQENQSLWELYGRGTAPKVSYKYTVLTEQLNGKKNFTVIEEVK